MSLSVNLNCQAGRATIGSRALGVFAKAWADQTRFKRNVTGNNFKGAFYTTG
jgi:hypothetical protein